MYTVSTQGRKVIETLQRRVAMVECTSDAPQSGERRQSVRYEPVNQRIAVLVTRQGSHTRPATMVDISADGVRLVMDAPPPVGEVVRLAFDLPDARIEVNAEVRHAGEGDTIRYIGLQFTDALVGPAIDVGSLDSDC
jgi:hypothetical protein